MPGLINHKNILRGKIFISTRESGSSYELINSFKNSGAEIIEFPMIQTLPLNLSKRDEAIFRQLGYFQWIIFTSANGVKYFFEYIKKVYNSFVIPETIKIAVIGRKTADKLIEYNHTPHFIGQGHNSESFSQELKIEFQNKNPKILLPTSFIARHVIEERLKDCAEIKRLNLYNTVKPESVDQKIINEISNGHYDIIFFFSPSAVNNFYEITKGQIKLKKIRAACIGYTTEKACINIGITPIFTAKKPDTGDLVLATIEYLKNRNFKN